MSFKAKQNHFLKNHGIFLVETTRKNLLQKVISTFAKSQFSHAITYGNTFAQLTDKVMDNAIIPSMEEKMDWDKEDLDRFVRLMKLSASEVAIVALHQHTKYMPEEKFYPHSGILYLVEEIIGEWLEKHFDKISESNAWLAIFVYANSNQFTDDFMVKFNRLAEMHWLN